MPVATAMQMAVAVASMPVTVAHDAAMPVVMVVVVPVPSVVRQLEFTT